jgi:membrane protease YdiL (CAAX protease family)
MRTADATRIGETWTWLTTPPGDDATDADRRIVDLVGLRLPARASAVVVVAIVVLLLDYSQVLVPASVVQLGRSPDYLLAQALQRVLLFGVVPMAVVTLGFRDHPGRYGWTLGDIRAGAFLAAAGMVVMTPVVLWSATLPDVRAYYATGAAPLAQVVLTNVLDLVPAEFLFRGFLMLTLVRVVGPIGVLIAIMPFAYSHIGKPVLELLSTLAGGLAYGWLAWRTRSIVWGSIAHVYILSLVTLAAA